MYGSAQRRAKDRTQDALAQRVEGTFIGEGHRQGDRQIATLEAADESAQEEPAAEPTPRSEQQPEPTAEPLPEADDPEPVPYVPAGRPGSAEAYSEMIDRLAKEEEAEQ